MNNSKPYNISVVFLLLLLIGSMLFYKERMFFSDSSYVLFEMINTNTFIISEHRYGAFITQLFPLLGIQVNAPLNAILLLYSTSFYLFFLFVVLFSGHILKQKSLAILFVFYLCFMVTDVYFWANNEIHQSAGWMVLFLSVWNYAEQKQWKTNKLIHLGLICALFFSIISHILILIPFSYLWLYSFLDIKRNSRQLKLFLCYSALIVVFAVLRYYLSHDSSYDGYKLEGVKHISVKSFFNALVNDQSISFFKLLLKKYWTFLIVGIIGLVTLLCKKKTTLTILTISFIGIYYSLVVLTHSVKITESNLFYFESQWMCLSLIVCYPFLKETMTENRIYKMILILFLLIYIFKILQLNKSTTKFKLRLSSLQTLVDTAKEKQYKKSYIFKSKDVNDALLLTWALPAETALLSSTDKTEESVTIKIFGANSYISSSPDSIYSSYDLLHHSWINEQYFRFSNNSSYTPLYND